ncbi:MAG: TRCF domain-containing protein, partial [Kiritimatiellia bacterium]
PEQVDDGAACCLPVSYIEDEALRVDIYRRIAALSSIKNVEALKEELNDRFGHLPVAAENALQVARIRIAASNLGLLEVDVRHGKVLLRKRNGDVLQENHRYPRLTATKATDKLGEILQILGQTSI